MKFSIFRILGFAILIAVTGFGFAQAPTDSLGLDPFVIHGKLPNGFTYYIRRNQEPKNRVSMRLAVKVGSLQEDPDQQGLAHFIEHMAFNGTKNFKKQELVDYLEKIGTRFGADLNAETSFESTVYQLQLPTEPAILDKAYLIFQDWAHAVSFEPEEVEKERGVVIEEWRGNRGAQARIIDKQFPLLFHKSRYAERLPIGQVEILQKAPVAVFERFYRDWYRPDLMAFIVVGDIDPAQVEATIKAKFSGLVNPPNPRPRESYPVPDHQETLFGIEADPEMTRSTVEFYYKRPTSPQATVADYRTYVVRQLNQSMASARLDERTQEANPPFVAAYASYSNLVETKDAFAQGAMVKEAAFGEAIEALMVEARRVREHGFTASELDRQKKEFIHSLEQAFKERDKTNSEILAVNYVDHFVSGEATPGIEMELKLAQNFIPGITLEEVNAESKSWITDNNRVILVSAPKKDGFVVPTREDILAMLAKAEKVVVPPYVDRVSDAPLLEKVPQPGSIVKELAHPEVGVTEWKLSNGATVYLKPTDFKNDEILFAAQSFGGSSVVGNDQYVHANTASMLVGSSGLGSFDSIQLEKKLTGKTVSLEPFINELEEGFTGTTTPTDLETMLQLLNLYFSAPQVEERVFSSLRTRFGAIVENRDANPETVFRDALEKLLYQNHPRFKPFDKEQLLKMDGPASLKIFKERFREGGDFQYFFVGNFKLETIKPLVETYIASLTAPKQPERWSDIGATTVTGPQKLEVDKGLEPKSSVQIIFTGKAPWGVLERYQLQSLTAALNIRLREIMREDMGGVYGVGVHGSLKRWPKETFQTVIRFDCDPKMVDSLVSAALTELERAAKEGFDPVILEKVKETQLRTFEVNSRNNGFWLQSLAQLAQNGLPLDLALKLPERVKSLTNDQLKTGVGLYFAKTNHIVAVLKPAPGVTDKKQ